MAFRTRRLLSERINAHLICSEKSIVLPLFLLGGHRREAEATFLHMPVQKKSVNKSPGLTESAFASLTMFSRATFRSPRSTPPT